MDPADISKNAPGVFGALVGVFLMKDTWARRLALFLSGVASSYYGANYVAAHTAADLGLSGFITGLFSMAIVAKLIESVEAISPKDLVDRFLRRLGL